MKLSADLREFIGLLNSRKVEPLVRAFFFLPFTPGLNAAGRWLLVADSILWQAWLGRLLLVIVRRGIPEDEPAGFLERF